MAFLKAVGGSNVGQIWDIKEPRCILGRHPDCDVAIDHLDASRHHAQIVTVGGDYFVEDLHSRNGTWLNRERVGKRLRLSDGDNLRISETILEFHGTPPRPSPKTAPSVLVEDRAEAADPSSVIQCEVPSTRDSERSSSLIRAELTALLEIAYSLRKTLVLDELFPLVLDSIFKIFPTADRGFIVFRAEDGTPTPRWIKVREGHAGQEARLSSAIISRVMDTQQSVLSADAAGDFRFKSSESLSESPIRSVMCAPLVDAEGRSLGVIQIDTLDERGRYRDTDLHVFAAVATQASIAFDNARLHEQALRQREIERDLELADQIQRSFLPASPPQIAGYRFFDYYRPASYVGGDYYNYITLPDGRLAVVVADVVGHGLAAAMLTAKFAAEARYQLLTAGSLTEAVGRINASLSEAIGDNHFITLVLIVLEPATGQIRVVTAGHPPAIFCPTGGPTAEIGAQKSGFPLGAFEGAGYEESSFQVPSGGLLLAYTDGVTEAMNARREVYGLPRLCRQLQAACGDPLRFGHCVVDDLQKFLGTHPQIDDMCLVCFGRE
jgi:serine phosphatase RsbU (regulator of sigma subunit)/pSer/pThr/pTyr-binding forkhead associated (FHA) protein